MAQAHMPYGGSASVFDDAYEERPHYGYSQGYHAQPYRAFDDEADAREPEDSDDTDAPRRGGALSGISQALGALMSLSLVAGVSYWSYELIMRDVSGVPIVRASDVPMRITPATPGGSQAAHQGLSVNEVAGRGAASGPVDELRLAPAPVDLAPEDAPVAVVREASLQDPGPTENIGTEVALANTAPNAPEGPVDPATAIQALADQIVAQVTASQAGTVPADPTAASADVVQTAAQGPVTAQLAVATNALSLRPQARPTSLVTASLTAQPAALAVPSVIDIDPSALPAGTRLVQLGAYETVENAQSEWARIATQFDSFFDEKRRVIEQAQAGGRTFYRLRAEGFADLGDARRFCAALVAENTDCIPVVTR